MTELESDCWTVLGAVSDDAMLDHRIRGGAHRHPPRV